MQKRRLSRWFFVVGISLIFLTSCRSYYMVRQVSLMPRDSVYSLVQDTLNYVIVHYKNKVIHISEVRVDTVADIITGKAEAVSREHETWQDQVEETGNPYNRTRYSPLHEVHLMADEVVYKFEKEPSIRGEDIHSVKCYVWDSERNQKASTGRWTFGGTAAVLIVAGIAIAVAMMFAQGFPL